MKQRKYLEAGAVVTDSSSKQLKWNGNRFEGIDKELCDLKFEGSEIYYAWDAPEGSQNRGKPYIEVSKEGN